MEVAGRLDPWSPDPSETGNSAPPLSRVHSGGCIQTPRRSPRIVSERLEALGWPMIERAFPWAGVGDPAGSGADRLAWPQIARIRNEPGRSLTCSPRRGAEVPS